MSPAELYGKVILVDEFDLIVTICLYPSLLPIFKFSNGRKNKKGGKTHEKNIMPEKA